VSLALRQLVERDALVKHGRGWLLHHGAQHPTRPDPQRGAGS
jgi:hypothetical protein